MQKVRFAQTPRAATRRHTPRGIEQHSTLHAARWAALLVVGACSSGAETQNNLLLTAGSSAPVVPKAGAAGTTPSTPAATAGRTAPVGMGVPTAGAGTTSGASGAAGGAYTAAGAGAASTMGVAGNSPGTLAGSGAGAGTAGAAGSPSTAGASAGTAGAAGAANSGGKTTGSVMVTFTTVSYDGEYAPLNYGAVWFETGDGKFVKTAKRWAGTVHASDLAKWTEASGGWGSPFGGGGNMADQMDAMSSATLRMHQTHMVTWNALGIDKQLAADGEYVAVLEMTESRARDNEGKVLRIPFTKGPMPATVMVPDDASFKGITLTYTPN